MSDSEGMRWPLLCRLTNSVYLRLRDASEGAGTHRRQINLVGLNRHPEQVLVGDIEVCKLGELWHAQIMTSDAARVQLGASVLSAIALATDRKVPASTHNQALSAMLFSTVRCLNNGCLG